MRRAIFLVDFVIINYALLPIHSIPVGLGTSQVHCVKHGTKEAKQKQGWLYMIN